MKKYAILLLVVCAGATVMIAGCTSSTNPSPSPNPSASPVTSTSNQNTISVQNYAFSPSTLSIQKGANVTWKNGDSVPHRILSDTNAFNSPVLNNGDVYTFQFNNTGTFAYHCSIHTNMTGTITVTATSTATSTAAPTAAPTVAPTAAPPIY
jgi:plastocyanin